MTTLEEKKRSKKETISEAKTKMAKESDHQTPVIPSEKPGKKESVALRLKKARVARKMTVIEVSKELRIRRDYISAIEEGQLDRLPEQAYTLGFVRSYANLLGLDGLAAVKEYREERDMTLQSPIADRISDACEAATPSKKLLFVSALTASIVLALGWFYVDERQERLPKKTISTSQEPIPKALSPELKAAPSSPEAPPTPAAPPPSSEAPLLPSTPALSESYIHATEKVWIKVYGQDGKTIKDILLAPGEKIAVHLDGSTYLSTGNVGALTLESNGKKTPFLGKLGEVKRHIPLEEKAIKEYVSSDSPSS